MGIVLVYLEGMYLWKRELIYEKAAKFWTKIFALNFAIGVASGIVMEFQFGTNWAIYSRFVGDVFGSALAAEGIFAFFLESGFLAVLVFGWDRVGPKMHFFSTCMVALGSMFSAIWIVVANSWQQTPAGHHIVQMMRDGEPWFIDGVPVMRAEIVDFWALVFNPSSVIRLTHTLIGCFVVGAFFIMSISAWYLLKGRHTDFARRSFTGALLLATVASIGQAVSGHQNAHMVAVHQPAKLAAFEGHFTTGPASLSLLGLPDAEAGAMRYNLAIPGGLSFLVTGDLGADVIGLDSFPKEQWPPIFLSFTSYHLMVGIGVCFIGLTLLACVLRWRGTLFEHRWLLWIFVGGILLAIIANHLGWTAAEVGRQPWVVHPRMQLDEAGEPIRNELGHIQYRMEEGLLTKDGVSRAVSGGQVAGSILGFGAIYTLLFAVWLLVLNSKIQHGPEGLPALEGEGGAEGFLDAASRRPVHSDSLTDSRSSSQPDSAAHGSD